MLELSWYDSGPLKLDQVTHATDTMPVAKGARLAGTTIGSSAGINTLQMLKIVLHLLGLLVGNKLTPVISRYITYIY
ncbi:MAG: hypothetical protein EZS28_029502, partial [Streblomastix strix]